MRAKLSIVCLLLNGLADQILDDPGFSKTQATGGFLARLAKLLGCYAGTRGECRGLPMRRWELLNNAAPWVGIRI